MVRTYDSLNVSLSLAGSEVCYTWQGKRMLPMRTLTFYLDISSYENLQRTTLLNLFTGFLYRSVYIVCIYQKAFELPPNPIPFMFNIWKTILGLYEGIC